MAEPARAPLENSAGSPDVYAPYGQIIKMLLPSVGCIAIYRVDGELIWCSDGFERPDLRELVERLQTTGGLALQGAIESMSSGGAAFVSALGDDPRTALGALIVELDGSKAGRTQPSMIISMLRPVLDCISTRLNLDRTVVSSGQTRSPDLDLLVSVDDENRDDPSALQRLLRTCLQHLGCSAGSLLLPDKNLAISATVDHALVNSNLIDRTRKHLLAWAQLNNRPMVVNRVAKAPDAAPYKILSCPVRDLNGQVAGIIALFRPAEGEDFELRDVRIVDFVSRKVVAVLHSHYDSLTRLINRLIFERRVQKLLDGGGSSDMSLLYIDIDRLAAFNDAFGLSAGDEVIQRVASVVQRGSGPTAIASRVGGDRFAVFLPRATIQSARELAQQILGGVRQLSYTDGDTVVPVTVSVGATLARRQQRIAHLLAGAELACKRAKQAGGNQLYSPDSDSDPSVERELIALAASDLEQALKANDFRIDAQPIVGLAAEGLTLGYELLVRMRDRQGQILAPEKFFDAAERHEVMPAVDRWVLCRAIDELRPFAESLAKESWCFAFNVSAQSLAIGSYADFALEQIRAANLPPSLFCFEIKEVAGVSHVAAAETLIRALTGAGCRVALDNFGCGLSSLAHLKRLPVNYLKIDGRLVRRLLTDRIAESIVSGLARAAATLGIQAIAEHVEDAATVTKLRELDVQFAQGFHFGRPQPLTDFLARLVGEKGGRAS